VLSSLLGGGSWMADKAMTAAYVGGVLGTIGAIAIVVEAASRVLRGPGGFLVRIGELVLGLGGLYAIWAIVVYGLANFSLTY
jgi:uncharacterized membrane protein